MKRWIAYFVYQEPGVIVPMLVIAILAVMLLWAVIKRLIFGV